VNDERPVLLIDALNLFTRHFVAHPAMSDHGHHVGGIVGFLNSINRCVDLIDPEKIIVVWESGGSSKRRSQFSEYKTHRKPQKLNRFYEDEIPNTVESQNDQISVIVELLKHMPICQIYVPDCEADDVIGYVSKYFYENKKKVILSSDKDFYQLLNKNTIIYSPTSKKFINANVVCEKFGILADNFCLVKAICGDPSDNIPGIKGAGFKTVAKRFPMLKAKKDVTIEDIIETASIRSQEKRSPKIYNAISQNEKIIKRNWKLMYLDTFCLSSFQIDRIRDTLDTFQPKRNKMNTMRTLIREGIKTLNIDRLFLSLRRIV